MSFGSINQCANDEAFIGRVTACAAQERYPDPPTITWTWFRWPVASAADIEAAYKFAVDSENPNPGGDDTVITDGMILSAVQANPPQEAP